MKGFGKGGTCPSNGTGDVISKLEMLVDKVVGDMDPSLPEE